LRSVTVLERSAVHLVQSCYPLRLAPSEATPFVSIGPVYFDILHLLDPLYCTHLMVHITRRSQSSCGKVRTARIRHAAVAWPVGPTPRRCWKTWSKPRR
jgi:hypothetical protein